MVHAFSVVEVTFAVGVIAFSMIAVIGLLPTGLNTQRASQEQARAAAALAMVASAAESLRPVAGETTPTWAFPSYFSNQTNPTRVVRGQSTWTVTFFLDDNGRIVPDSDTTTRRRQTMFVRISPPQAEGQPVQIYALVAWPNRPTDSSNTTLAQLSGRQGFIDTVVAYVPTTSF